MGIAWSGEYVMYGCSTKMFYLTQAKKYIKPGADSRERDPGRKRRYDMARERITGNTGKKSEYRSMEKENSGEKKEHSLVNWTIFVS